MTSDDGTILVVDDDRDYVASLKAFLESHGFAVPVAHDGEEGLATAKRERPDLILMDVMMTERTEGFFTIQQIRRTPGLSRVPVFVLSSIYQDEEDFRVEPESGWLAHDAFFPKPLDLDALLEAIRDRLGATGDQGDREVASLGES